MRILIIGGSRFVGPYLIDQLLAGGHEVTVFNRGQIRSGYPGVEFVQGDRNDGFHLGGKFDTIVDMCAYNARHTETVLQQLNFDFLVHLSTAAVYKKPLAFPLRETDPLGDWPLWGAYNKGKVACEMILAKSGRGYASLRPVYILGPANYCDREHFIYSRLHRKEPLTLPGDGQAVVQFVFVDEVAASLALLATGQKSGAYNCAGSDTITLEGLVRNMADICGEDPRLKYNKAADGSAFQESEFPFANENFSCSNDKIRQLGVRFRPLRDGLKNDYQSYYSMHLG